jgi:hypothetical protein
MSRFSGESSWLYGARIGQIVRIFDLTGLEPNDTLTHRMNSNLVQSDQSGLSSHTRTQSSSPHCTQIRSNNSVRAGIATRSYFSVLNRFISAIQPSYFDESEWESVQVINFFISRNYLNFPPPKSQLLNSFCDWWRTMSPRLRKFPQDITFFTTGSRSSLSHMFCFCICVHAAVFITIPS